MNLPIPVPLGLKKSFGFGDRLGLATPGHLDAVRGTGFAPIFAQQSIREMARTQRTPEDVMNAARTALATEGFGDPWGADADHLKTPEDVQKTAAAGFCFFTIDPSAHVNNAADGMTVVQLAAEVSKIEAEGVFGGRQWKEEYLRGAFDVGAGPALRFTQEGLLRAVVKYGRAVAHAERMGRAIAAACAGRGFEIEVSVDETDSPTHPLEHLFFGRELRERRVPNVVSLAPRFVGEFEKGIDYRGDLVAFEASLKQHVAIARHCGPYKISIHSGSDKFAVYPAIGRVCGPLLHVKTAGTSYLEALRVVARTAPALFAEIAEYCRGRFAADRQSYHISTTEAEIGALSAFRGKEDEPAWLDDRVGRQLLHVTFGSVLTLGADASGRPFKVGILEQLNRHADLHRELLTRHLRKHLDLLNAG
ncbi:MAG: hypothetical protein JNL97_03275 [Verrucomicrobiales bacterium]|nr:hypothetical protein [Verrucomicrobiales bacterium]